MGKFFLNVYENTNRNTLYYKKNINKKILQGKVGT